MARKLKKQKPVWVTVAGDKEQGTAIEFLMRRADALDHDLAIERASRAARNLARLEDVRRAYGLDELPDDLMIEEEDDAPAALLGISTVLQATELALIVATDWRGYVEDVEGGEEGEVRPVEFSRRNVAMGMSDWHGAQSLAWHFLQLSMAPVFAEHKEGKPCAAAPNISGAAAQESAGDAET
ncbi:hypothetical protein [Hyphomonas pacifica]|uniref:Uncharacterized protein n=1 Tax=Hyphomonas pacifica TaxID=1280941 RepID=A0A8B2PKR7_9PROT|nr:hypothetical protein [Hyphomonas pacifica]RAN30632.1 hypothetical protein HY3_05640 [Hyphomonas pacifica]